MYAYCFARPLRTGTEELTTSEHEVQSILGGEVSAYDFFLSNRPFLLMDCARNPIRDARNAQGGRVSVQVHSARLAVVVDKEKPRAKREPSNLSLRESCQSLSRLLRLRALLVTVLS